MQDFGEELWCRIWSAGFGCRTAGAALWVQHFGGAGLGVQGFAAWFGAGVWLWGFPAWLWLQDVQCRALGAGLGVQDWGCRALLHGLVQDFGCGVSLHGFGCRMFGAGLWMQL